MKKKYAAPDGRMVSRQRLYQIRHAARGLCIYCGQVRSATSRLLCEAHRLKRRKV